VTPDEGSVIAAAARYPLEPILVHSTSWRHEGDRLGLTYLAVVEPPDPLSPYLTAEPVGRSDLARGDPLAPPTDIGITQVIEHAFRHLAWLVGDDPAIGAALPDWVPVLAAYEPEPFRAIGGTPG
jgi:hypothetical protein